MCTFDPQEHLRLADSENPVEKIRKLEDQIGTHSRTSLLVQYLFLIHLPAELKRKLEEAGIANSPPTSELSNDSHISDRRLSSLAPPSYNMAASPDPPAPRSDISLPRAGLNVVDTLRTGSPRTSNTSSPDLTLTSTESLLSLFAFGWNPDLPDPAEMRYLFAQPVSYLMRI